MTDAIIGICRFSFLGKCDWVETRHADGGTPEVLERRQGVLYAEDRLRRRFEAFEKICLPSLRTQTDPDFRLWLLTSPELPAPWLDRLTALCAQVPQAEIIVSAARKPCDALAEPLAEAADRAGRPVLQFRIDDDDALSCHHVARLRRNAKRFDDLPAFGLSSPRGLLINGYQHQPTTYWRVHQAFVGAGAALRLNSASRSIFSVIHPSIPRFFPGFTDLDGLGYLQTRWDAGDSAVNKRDAVMPRHFAQINEAAFRKALAKDFPALQDQDFSFIWQDDS